MGADTNESINHEQNKWLDDQAAWMSTWRRECVEMLELACQERIILIAVLRLEDGQSVV